MSYKAGDAVYLEIDFVDATGALADPSAKSGALIRNGTADGTVTVSWATRGTGKWTASCTIPSGYAVGDSLSVEVSATVGGIGTGEAFGLGRLSTIDGDVAALKALKVLTSGVLPSSPQPSSFTVLLSSPAFTVNDAYRMARLQIVHQIGLVEEFIITDYVGRTRQCSITPFPPRYDLAAGDLYYVLSETQQMVADYQPAMSPEQLVFNYHPGDGDLTFEEVVARALELTGNGDTPVDHNTGGTDALQITLSGVAADDAEIQAYLKTEYDAGTRRVVETTFTGPDGRWLAPLMLNAGVAYTLVIWIPGESNALVHEVTP